MAPENTQAAFDLAVAYQADVLETDVRLSKDGVVMVTHDATLKRTSNGRGRVREHTASELQQLDVGCRFIGLDGEAYRGQRQRMFTLAELLQHYPQSGINIDIKDRGESAARAVATVIHAHRSRAPSSQWINVGSFHAHITHAFRRLSPDTSTAATRQEVARLVFGKAARITPAYRLLQIPPHYWGFYLSGERLIEKIYALRKEVVYWTINDTEKMTKLLQKGCHGIVTDRPDLALREFKRLGFK